MKKLFLIFISLIFLLCFYSSVQAMQLSIDEAEQECISKTSNTQAMNQCSNIAMKAWEKDIKKTLSEFKYVLDKDSYKNLINSQSSWEKYKIDEFKLIDKMLENKQGTMYLNVDMGFKVDLVRQRALKLQEYLKTIKD